MRAWPGPVEHAPSPVAIDGTSPLRAMLTSDPTSVSIIIERRAEGWKIVEELGLYY